MPYIKLGECARDALDHVVARLIIAEMGIRSSRSMEIALPWRLWRSYGPEALLRG